MKVVSLIPARGGSKSIPMKNIAWLNDRYLISYVLQSSLKSKVEETWVSTDNTDIKIVCLEEDIEVRVLDRLLELAQDNSSTEDVMMHFAEHVGFDTIVLIQPTSPMVTAEQIDEGLTMFECGEYDSLFSAVRTDDILIWEDIGFDVRPLNYDPLNRGQRQTRVNDYFVETGGFYITSRDQLLETCCRVSGKIGIVEVPFWTSFQVDTMEDLEGIERLMK